MRYVMTAIGGALVWWIVLMAGLGWMSPGSAQKQADAVALAALVEKLTPICIANYEADAERDAKWKVVKDAAYYSRDDVFAEQGWVTFKGSDEPDKRIAQPCRSAIADVAKS